MRLGLAVVVRVEWWKGRGGSWGEKQQQQKLTVREDSSAGVRKLRVW